MTDAGLTRQSGRQREEIANRRWRDLSFWPLLVASIIFIVAYSWQVIADLEGTAELVARILILVTWAIFVAEYLVRFARAKPRTHWVLHHPFDLILVLVPPLRPLLLLKAITTLKPLRASEGAALRSSLAIYGAGAALIMIWIAAVAILSVERPAPGANIVNFGDAVWWAFVTITSVGYGDFYPITGRGRFVAVLLMCAGVAVVGIVTATLASWILEKAAADGDDNAEPATRGQVRDLSRQMAAFLAGSAGETTADAKGSGDEREG